MYRTHGLVMLACAVVLALTAGGAAAQISCANPNNLCTGNPCVIGETDVASPCVVDFGNRTVIVEGPLRVPNGGVLELRGAMISVERPILGRHTSTTEGDGAHVSLIATGNIFLRRRIDVSARFAPGSIVLNAGGDVLLSGVLRARTKGRGATAAGGAVSVTAGRSLLAGGRGRIDARGSMTTDGGVIGLIGNSSVTVRAPLDARGKNAGMIGALSSTGSVLLADQVRAQSVTGLGGRLIVVAAVEAAIERRVDADGPGGGGAIGIVAGRARVQGSLRVRSTAAGGSLSISATGDVSISERVRADGSDGGAISISTRTGDVVITDDLNAQGTDGMGGRVAISSGDDLSFTPSVEVRAEGDSAGGEIRLSANGDMTLSGLFRARAGSGGVIEGRSNGNLIADGRFSATNGGCIGLSAGGALDTSSGLFDGPVVPSCP